MQWERKNVCVWAYVMSGTILYCSARLQEGAVEKHVSWGKCHPLYNTSGKYVCVRACLIMSWDKFCHFEEILVCCRGPCFSGIWREDIKYKFKFPGSIWASTPDNILGGGGSGVYVTFCKVPLLDSCKIIFALTTYH